MPGAQQSIIINATPDKVFQVITDYANYPKFLKEVSSCVVDSRDGNSVTIGYVARRAHWKLAGIDTDVDTSISTAQW